MLQAHTSIILGMIIMIASLLPAIHALGHEDIPVSKSSYLDVEISDNTSSCSLCDFHLASSTTPTLFAHEIFNAQKEIAYAISLTDTVNLFPDPLFSLRAPPVC